jgi:interferon gamma-inducible protein 30
MKTNLIFILTIITLPQLYTSSPAKIDIYIASLCPYSRFFVEDSFKKFQAFEHHYELASVNFYTHGKATETTDGTYQCQHGPNECKGNLIHTCAKAKLDKETFHEFLICIFNDIKYTNDNFTESLHYCVPGSKADEIESCSKSTEGNRLQHEVADKTPDDFHVPWVIVNDQPHNQRVEDEIREDMLRYLCKDRQEVPGCKDLLKSFINNHLK